MRIFGLKNCDTCRKAKKALPDSELVDVRETPMDDGTLARAYVEFGDTLVNTRSATWRGLSEAERQSDALELIRAYPAVMKRPLIDDGTTMYLGWTADIRKTLNVA